MNRSLKILLALVGATALLTACMSHTRESALDVEASIAEIGRAHV